jgi:membrane protease subunit HflC
LRGEGDAERNRIFAEAFNRDPDFFAFYRSMQAYETGLRHNDTRLLLKPDGEFFRYFGNPMGKPRETERAAAPAPRAAQAAPDTTTGQAPAAALASPAPRAP